MPGATGCSAWKASLRSASCAMWSRTSSSATNASHGRWRPASARRSIISCSRSVTRLPFQILSARLTSRSSVLMPGVPRCVAAGEAGESLGDSPGDQQVVAGHLVRGAGPGELLGAQDLPDVVAGGSEEDGVSVEVQLGVVPFGPVDQLVGDIVDGPKVGREPGWGIQLCEEDSDLAREWSQYGVAGQGEGSLQRGGHSGHGRPLNVGPCCKGGWSWTSTGSGM